MGNDLGPEGSETNPVKLDSEHVDLSALPWNDRPSLYVQTPSGQISKCYYSYADYCED